MRKLFDAMYRHAHEACDKVAVSDSEEVIHRADLLAKVIGLAADIKTQSGTIGILAPNGIDWVIAQLACALAGKIAAIEEFAVQLAAESRETMKRVREA
jgi:acyl-CoA synthetase (AMP-forming)/AMP-acid ligase II